MELGIQKRLAGSILKCSPKRVWFDPARLEEIKEAITKADLRSLIKDKAIVKFQAKGVSRARAKVIQKQKSKGKQKGKGSRKGRRTSRLPRKEAWMNRIRAQRVLIKRLKEKKVIEQAVYVEMYRKSKGGFFRSTRHIKLYLNERGLIKK